MRLPAGLIFVAALVVASDARAQETSIPLNAEAAEQVQRTPALIIRELVSPPRSDKQLPAVATNTQGAPTKNAASKSSAAGAPSAPATAPPIVLPGATAATTGGMQTTGNPKYDELIAQSAARNGVDPNLIVAVMRQESGFNSRARSYKGATGLMQLMPATAARFGVTNIFDAGQNIEGGTRYLRFLLDSFNGDIQLVLAGYNAGENAVVNSGYRIPRYRETQNYVRSISARYDVTRNISKRAPSSFAPSAPSVAVFAGGAASSRLSNNY